MECGVIADSGYFSVAYPHLSGNFYAKHQAEVILNSTLSPNSIPVRQHKAEGVINFTLLTPHFSLSPNSIPVRQHKVEGVINSTLLTPHFSLLTVPKLYSCSSA